MKRLIHAMSVLICSAASAFACWQTDWPGVVLATQSVNLRLIVTDKAQDTRVSELHKAITLNPKQKPPEQFYEKKVLKSATTDSRGLASFGEVAPGTYRIVGGANEIALTAVPPSRSGAKRVWVNETADGYIGAGLEKAD